MNSGLPTTSDRTNGELHIAFSLVQAVLTTDLPYAILRLPDQEEIEGKEGDSAQRARVFFVV